MQPIKKFATTLVSDSFFHFSISLYIHKYVNKDLTKKQESPSSCYFTAKKALLQEAQSANKSTESSYSCTGRRMASHEQHTCSPLLCLHRVGLNQQNFLLWRQHRPTHLPPTWNKCPHLLDALRNLPRNHHMNQLHKELLMLQSLWTLQQFSCPKYSRAVCSHCPLLVLLCSLLTPAWSAARTLQKGAQWHPTQGGKPSNTMGEQYVLFWGSRECSVSPI